MKIEMTAAEASDVLDDLATLDGQWSATYRLYVELQAIVKGNQADTDTTIYATAEELNRRWYVEGYPE